MSLSKEIEEIRSLLETINNLNHKLNKHIFYVLFMDNRYNLNYIKKFMKEKEIGKIDEIYIDLDHLLNPYFSIFSPRKNYSLVYLDVRVLKRIGNLDSLINFLKKNIESLEKNENSNLNNFVIDSKKKRIEIDQLFKEINILFTYSKNKVFFIEDNKFSFNRKIETEEFKELLNIDFEIKEIVDNPEYFNFGIKRYIRMSIPLSYIGSIILYTTTNENLDTLNNIIYSLKDIKSNLFREVKDVMKSKIKFQTYSWVIGTTSFRVSETKYKIEKQLLILDKFRQPLKNIPWRYLQDEYFNHLVENELANDKLNGREKDARQISSSLEYIGLINKERFLQPTAYKILEILREKNFNFDNIFGVRNDSYFYLKQYLKLEFSENIGNNSYSTFHIKPFIAVIYTLLRFENIVSKDFFTYVMPTSKTYDELKDNISNPPQNIDNFLLQKISSMENYQEALKLFVSADKTEALFKDDNVFMNMNGGKNDLKYLEFYSYLKTYNFEWSFKEKIEFLQNIEIPRGTTTKFFYQKLFSLDKKPNKNKWTEEIVENFENSFIFTYSNDFETNFFYLIHLYKWKKNLEEYFDLNRRFLSLTDIFIFESETVSLDEVAYSIFKSVEDDILNLPFASSQEKYFNQLNSNLELNQISDILEFDLRIIVNELKTKYPEIERDSNLSEEIQKIKSISLKNRFDSLIQKYFSINDITKLLLLIKQRNDKEVLKHINWDADVPTIFEYLLGISWYLISDKKGDLTKILNLSLDSNLLPRRFAGGGQADIIYKYDNHDLLIEATLSDKNSQRKMELEPVSRHLGRYKIDNGDNHYAIFVAPYLDPNVLVSFRSYKNLPYYNPSNTNQYTNYLKIIPLDIDDLIQILEKSIKYSDLEKKFHQVFQHKEENGFIWYYKFVKKSFYE